MPHLSWVVAALLIHAPAAQKGAPGVTGEYASPLGRIRIACRGDVCTGKVLAPAPGCSLRKGDEVLRATRLGRSLAGDLRACLSGERCVAREAWGDVVLLAAGDRLAGAVHVAVQGCRPPAGPHGGIVLERSRSGAAPAPRPVAAARERASPVLREAAAALSAGDLEAARRRFLAAVAIDPSSAEACNGVGVTSRLRNDLGDALAWYERALAADPDLGAPYYNLACVHALRGETALALRWLRMAVLLGHVGAAAMEQDPDLEAVRAEPAFRALVGGRS